MMMEKISFFHFFKFAPLGKDLILLIDPCKCACYFI